MVENRIEEIVLADGSSANRCHCMLVDGDDVVQGSAGSCDSQAGNYYRECRLGNDIVRVERVIPDTLLMVQVTTSCLGDEGRDSLTVSYSGSNTLDGAGTTF
ncbi:hypothetical protein OH492_20500 [Vibrio chagasii]|nr:hypothetical protein [Vibrio chagasii]